MVVVMSNISPFAVVVWQGIHSPWDVALFYQILPPILYHVDESHDADLGCKRHVEALYTLWSDLLIKVHSNEDVDESQYHCCGAEDPVCSIPSGSDFSSTADQPR